MKDCKGVINKSNYQSKSLLISHPYTWQYIPTECNTNYTNTTIVSTQFEHRFVHFRMLWLIFCLFSCFILRYSQYLRRSNFRCLVDWWIIIEKRIRKEFVVSGSSFYPEFSYRMQAKLRETSAQPVSKPRFEPSSSRRRVWRATSCACDSCRIILSGWVPHFSTRKLNVVCLSRTRTVQLT
jgi:hypothetical protein